MEILSSTLRGIVVAGAVFGAAIIAAPSPAAAQIYNCDGQWTNKPCAGPRAVLKEETGTEQPEERIAREKRSALHELSMRSITARDQYDIRYDTGAVEDYCYAKSTSLDSCRERVETALDKLDEKIAKVAVVASEERRNTLREESNRIAAERANNTAVQVTENVYVLPRPRPRLDCPYGYHSENYRCVPHSGYHGSYGIGVHGSGPHGSVSIGAGGVVGTIPRPHRHSHAPVMSDQPRFKGYQDPGRPR